MAWSPPEQFATISSIPIHIGNLYFLSTNSPSFMLPTINIVLLLVHSVTRNGGYLVLNARQPLVEMIHDPVPRNSVNEQTSGASPVKQRFSPLIPVTPTSLSFRNLIGTIPYSLTVTSHSIITLGLSLSPPIGITIIGSQEHGLHFFSPPPPQGVPLALAPFLVLPEPIPHRFCASSPGICSSANMMAGYSSVKIPSGPAWTTSPMGGIMYSAYPAPSPIASASTGSESGAVISQAHAPITSIRIYSNDAINLH
uniref:ATP synthase subunit a n=1 Tax=Isoetes engelmannii TaxID=37427 RepID=C6G4A7_ISOEN|nr:ATP synthase F0 subunit a [Isoetes engelmannii]